MAQFSSQGRLKPLLNGDGFYELNEKHHLSYKVSGGWRLNEAPLVKVEFQKRKLGCSSRVFASNSSSFGSRFGSRSKESKSKKGDGFGGDGLLDEIVADVKAEFEVDELDAFKGLVLDISYRPVNVVCWKRAICLEFMEKADVLEYYDQTVNSPSGSFNIPAVLRVPQLLQVVKRRRISHSLSRKNIFYRDNYVCQYCSSGENLTIDHVIPISRGGEWTWENLVTACSSCNSTKGQKTLTEANMKLKKVPKVPKDYDILAIPLTSTAIKMLRKRKGTPEEWRQYLARPSS